MGYESLRQKTVELLQKDYVSSVLREEFDLALEQFTNNDWDRAAALALTTDSFEGLSYLFLAAQAGWEDISKKLLSHGTPVLHYVKINGKYSTPIQVAALKKHYSLVKILVEHASRNPKWDRDNVDHINIAYEAPPDVFEALAAHINVYKESRLHSFPDWFSLLKHHRHDIFSYLLKKGAIKDTLTEDSKLNYLKLLITCNKPIECFPEKEMMEALPFLLDAGVDINHETNSIDTALYYAIEHKYFNLARLIVESGKMNIAPTTASNHHIYHLLLNTKNYDFLRFLITKGFMTRHPNGTEYNVISIQLWRSYVDRGKDQEILSFLIDILPHVHKANTTQYKTIQRKVSGYLNEPRFIDSSLIDMLVTITHSWLFDENLPQGSKTDKKSALKYALSVCYAIMWLPNTAVSLLGDFEKRISQSWDSRHGSNSFEKALDCEFSLQEYVGLQWPVPLDHVKKEDFISKNGFLERECFAFFREKGFDTDNAVKMYDTIYDGTFEKLIANVVPFTESSLNPHLLIHGKNIHNIARILIMIAFEKGLIPCHYSVDGKEQQFSIKELFAAMIDPEFSHPESKRYAWASMFDMRAPTIDSFSDPQQMHSHLMTQCNRSLPYLSKLMTHSFCQAQVRLRKFVNDLTGQNWTHKQVWDRYITMRIPNIVTSDTKELLTFLTKTNKSPQDSHFSAENPVHSHRFARI